MPAPKSTESITQRYKDIIISSVISIVITIIFGYYFLYVGIIERRPTFFVDPTRTTILDQKNVGDAPLLLTKSNGDTINADVTSLYFYFFNQGKETIKRENIYAPLRIIMSDSAEILDFKVVKVARPVSGIEVTRDTTANALFVDLKALEQDDGFVGQIIFEGRKNSWIKMEGGIDGVKQFESRLTSIDPLYFVVAVVIFLISSYVFLLMSRRNPKSSARLLLVFSAIPTIYLLLMMYKTEWFVSSEVPLTLIMEQYDKQGEWIPGWFK